MSVTYSVEGYIEADEKWKAYKKIWDECERFDVSVPDEIDEYFDGVYPEDKPGKDIDIKKHVKEISNDFESGYEIDLKSLDPRIRYIRFMITC